MEIQKPTLPAVNPENDPILGEIQLMTELSRKTGVPLHRLGRVEWFNAVRGWGLIRIPGRERAVFVNSADIITDEESGPKSRFRFVQLFPGEVVSFELNEHAPRGPRAEQVRRIPSGIT